MSDVRVDDEMGAVARRKLHIIVMADTSGSMKGAKIESLNQAARTVVAELKEVAAQHAQAELMLRVIDFSTGAQWQTVEAQSLADYQWKDLTASGVTDLGAALDLLTEALLPKNLGAYQYPPVIAILSDGAPTDNWEAGLKRFEESPYGKKRNRTVRSAIAIGRDADNDVLARFTGNSETVLNVRNPEQMASFLRWATVTLSSMVSKGRSEVVDEDSAGPDIDDAPDYTDTKPVVDEDGDDDIF